MEWPRNELGVSKHKGGPTSNLIYPKTKYNSEENLNTLYVFTLKNVIRFGKDEGEKIHLILKNSCLKKTCENISMGGGANVSPTPKNEK